MADAPTPTAWHTIATGDRGSIPVIVLKDLGDVLHVQNIAAGIGGGTIRTKLWVKRSDFVPAPPLAP